MGRSSTSIGEVFQMKYLIKLESGRDAIINAEDAMDAAYIALDEAACMDDYLTDVVPIDD